MPGTRNKRGGGLRRWLGVMAILMLAGCAGNQAFREGQELIAAGRVEDGIARLEAAVASNPGNAEFRMALSTQRHMLLQRHLDAAEQARQAGRLQDAEAAYRRVLALSPGHHGATQGVASVQRQRRHQQVLSEVEMELGKPGGDVAASGARLRALLAEEPDNREAQRLQARLEEVNGMLARRETRLADAFRKTISLEFRDAPLQSVLDVVARIAGLNFFYDRDIRPDLKITVFTRDTTIEDAMRLVLATNQLQMKELGDNALLIYPDLPQKHKEYLPLSIRTFYLTNGDAKNVANSLRTLLRIRDIVVDERLGLLMIRETPEIIRMAERIIALQDIGDPEVMLEVEILEVKRTRLMELGIQWPSQLTLSPVPIKDVATTLATLKNLTQATTQANIGNMVINARAEDQDANVLANPRIRVRHKEKAKIQIGDRVPVITTTSTSTGFVSESVNYVDVGLKLEVEPTVYMDDEVGIKIGLEVSHLVREILSKSGTLSYQIGTRGANTVLRLRDGETQILAGLISDEDRRTANKMPGFGELPVLGLLFGSRKDDRQQSEILLSITPRILRSIRRPDLSTAEFDAGTDSSIGGRGLRMSGALGDAPPEVPVMPVQAPTVQEEAPPAVEPGGDEDAPPTVRKPPRL